LALSVVEANIKHAPDIIQETGKTNFDKLHQALIDKNFAL
jgi:hypothetical protein